MSSRGNDWEDAANAAPRPPAAPQPRVARTTMDPDRRAQYRESAEQKHRQSLQSIAESLTMARETAHTISMQSEQLSRNENAVDDAQYAVDLSKRIMRGMTWSGWIANAFTAPPTMTESTNRPDTTTGVKSDQPITMGFICPECKVMFKNAPELATHYSKSHDALTNDPRPMAAEANTPPRRPSTTTQTTTTVTTSEQDDVHEQFLRDLEPQLAELKQASYALGNAIETQNHQLDRLGDKIDKVHDGVKRVSVQAKKLTGTKLPVEFRFRCAFQEVETRKFIRDVDGEPVLGADILVDGCTFRAYTLGEDTEIWGFQSDSTSLFLGINRLGALKVRGGDLQSYEQFAIEVGKPTTTLFTFASYFGYGGWIVRRPSDDKLTIVRGSPENKASAARFKLINLDLIQAELSETKHK